MRFYNSRGHYQDAQGNRFDLISSDSVIDSLTEFAFSAPVPTAFDLEAGAFQTNNRLFHTASHRGLNVLFNLIERQE